MAMAVMALFCLNPEPLYEGTGALLVCMCNMPSGVNMSSLVYQSLPAALLQKQRQSVNVCLEMQRLHRTNGHLTPGVLKVQAYTYDVK